MLEHYCAAMFQGMTLYAWRFRGSPMIIYRVLHDDWLLGRHWADVKVYRVFNPALSVPELMAMDWKLAGPARPCTYPARDPVA